MRINEHCISRAPDAAGTAHPALPARLLPSAAVTASAHPDACEHALVRLLAVLHSQGSKQTHSQSACATRRPHTLPAISRLRARCESPASLAQQGFASTSGPPGGSWRRAAGLQQSRPRVQSAEVRRRVLPRSARSWQRRRRGSSSRLTICGIRKHSPRTCVCGNDCNYSCTQPKHSRKKKQTLDRRVQPCFRTLYKPQRTHTSHFLQRLPT